jgi:TonB family protein
VFFRATSKISWLVLAASATTGLLVSGATAQRSDISILVAPLLKEISHSHKATVVVLPLIGRNRDDTKLGIWLATQISNDLSEKVPHIQTLDASSSNLPYTKSDEPAIPVYDNTAVNDYAQKIGADLVVTGSYATFKDGLGVSLIVTKRKQEKLVASSNGKLVLTSELKDLLSSPLKFSPPPDGIYQAGFGGVGMSKCRKCPDPKFPEDERSKGIKGQVILHAVVGADGLVSHVEVLKSPSASFTEAAIAAVQKWRLEPALGPDGKPVAVRLPVQVSFRLKGY